MKDSPALMIEKPFSCDVDGCLMKFTNEDHLMVHKKRHDMVLNLGLGPKANSFSDQTPTPTRFIRNCEEVGLFQDLQNVNPFEETFRKAVEAVKMGQTPLLEKEIQSNSADDTLHTPNVFPHITDLPCIHHNEYSNIQEDREILEHSSKKDIEKNVNCNEKQTSKHIGEFQKLVLGNISHKKRKCEILEKVSNSNCSKLIHFEDNGNTQCEKYNVKNDTIGLNQVHSALKEKIRNNIFNKQLPIILELKVPIPKSPSPSGYQKCLKNKFSTFSKNSLKFASKLEKQESNIFDLSKKKKKLKSKNCLQKERIEILERNRAAATRCREKKKIYLLYLEKLTRDLTDANKKLQFDNTNLKKKISSLEEELLKHKNCSLTKPQEEKALSFTNELTEGANEEKLDKSQKLLIKYCGTINESKNGINESDAVKYNYAPKSDNLLYKEQESMNLSNNNNNNNSNNKDTILISKSGAHSAKSLCQLENFRKIYSDHSYFDYSNIVDLKRCMNSDISSLRSNSLLTSDAKYKFSKDKLDKLATEIRMNSNDLNTERLVFNSPPLILLKPFNKRRSKHMDKA